MRWAVLAMLFVCTAGACFALGCVVRARARRRLYDALHIARAGTPGSVGISVLCSGVTDPQQIERLLASEYVRYEVIAVLDARLRPVEFEALVARYRMIRVEWGPTGELPVRGVRALGRSRQRCFRRLVLIDRTDDGAAGDFDAAAAVATYEYLLPATEGVELLPGTVERLVAELADRPAGAVEAVRAWPGTRPVLLGREAVIRAGGFARHPLRSIPRSRRRTLWEPLVERPVAPRRRMLRRLGLGLAVAAVVGAAAGTGGWWAAAVLLTAAAVGTAWACAVRLVGRPARRVRRPAPEPEPNRI